MSSSIHSRPPQPNPNLSIDSKLSSAPFTSKTFIFTFFKHKLDQERVKIDSDIDSEWAGVYGGSRDQRMRVIRVNSDIDSDFVGKRDVEGHRGFDGGIDLGWVGGGGRESRGGSGGSGGRKVGIGGGEAIQEVDSEIDSGYLDMYSANSDIEEGYVDGGEIVPTKHVGGGR